jgi:2-polyprenyl-6-methoxyphenol hydroxylase-like FAD-dependent oxidoreductase
MRAKLTTAPPTLAHLVAQITDDDAVVYKPLEWVFLTGDWHNGRVALLGDAVHATTPHLGQGAGMAIEDSLVIAEELARHDSADDAFRAYRNRRFERCKYIVERSKAVGDGQIGKGPLVDNAAASREMFQVISAPL